MEDLQSAARPLAAAVALAALAALAVACRGRTGPNDPPGGPAAAPPAGPTRDAADRRDVGDSQALTDGVDGDGPALAGEPAVVAAVHDFAAAEGLSPDDVRVVQVEAVTWPDGALGCPSPGEMYTQALVPGYDVALAAGRVTARYHTNRGPAGAVFVRRCPDGALGAPGADPVVLDAVRRDLVARVGDALPVALETVGPAAATALVCPGTPEPPLDPTSPLQLAVTDVVFRAGADRHLYRIWNGRFAYCGLVGLPPAGPGTPTAATE